MRQTCPLKPIPHDEYFTQLSPTTFVLALSHPEMFRFSCGHSSAANLRLSGIVKITIPAGCIVSGSVLTLTPTSGVHFEGGVVSSLPLKSARDIELQLVQSFVVSHQERHPGTQSRGSLTEVEGPLAKGGYALVLLGQGAGSPGSSIWDGGLDPGVEELLHLPAFPNSGVGPAGNGGIEGDPGPSDHTIGGNSRPGRDD